jgi:hypothetical protein
MDTVKNIALVIGILAGIVAIINAIRNGVFYRPSLKLIVGLISDDDDIPKKVRKKTKRTFIFGTKPLVKNQSVLLCPYGIQNPTKKPITNVAVEFRYPIKYLLEDSVFFDEEAKEAILLRRNSNSQREVIRLIDVALVRYEFPLVCAGETIIFPDFIFMNKMTAKDFDDANPHEADIARLYERFGVVKKFFGACIIFAHISASNLRRPISKEIIVLSFCTADMKELIGVFNGAIKNVWDNKWPKPGIYFNPARRFIKSYKEELGEVVIQPNERLPVSEDAIARSMVGVDRGLIHFSVPPWGLHKASFDLRPYVGTFIKESK